MKPEQGRIMLGIALETNLQIHLSTLTNTFSNWDKYIRQLGKINSVIWTNTCFTAENAVYHNLERRGDEMHRI